MAAVDRISELPEPILHNILSSLCSKEAIQTTALSKTWRHVGPTLSKIELRESAFKKSGKLSFLPVLGKTLQRYYHQNLPVHEFILEMSDHREIDSEFTNDPGKTLFKGLKRLSLNSLHIKDYTALENIVRSCPLIEYLLVSDCVGLTDIPLAIFQAEFLTELHLTGRNLYLYSAGYLRGLNLIVPTDQLLLIKRLKTLSLKRVYIAEETLEKIMCGCPLIERLLLTDCEGLTNINLKNNTLKHFNSSFDLEHIRSIEIDAPTIETIRIETCPNWYGHDKYFFPRLKSLYLNKVELSAQLFESFSSSNFPSLEVLELQSCYGFEEIQLTVSSIKRLVITIDSFKRIVITINAPNIHYFKLSAHYPQQLIFNTETARKWKSHVVMLHSRCSDDKVPMLSKLLNSLRESQISLDVFPNTIMNIKVDQDPNDAGFCKPVSLECVRVKGYHDSSSFPDFLNCLFLMCRPRYIDINLYHRNLVTDLKQVKDKLVEFIVFKTIRNEEEMSRIYLWERDLEEISIQFWDQNSNGWRNVCDEGTSFPEFTSHFTKISFSLKWRDD